MSKTQSQNTNSYRKYVIFYSGQVISLFGSSVCDFAIILWVTLTTNNAFLISLAYTFSSITRLIATPIAGVYTDIWKRKKTIIISDFIQSFSTLGIIFGIIFGQDIFILIILMNSIRALCQSFQQPASNAIISLMIPKEKLSQINGLRALTTGFVQIICPPISAILIAIFPIASILWIDIITFLIAVIPLIWIKIPEIKKNSNNSEINEKKEFMNKKQKIKFFDELKIGFQTFTKIKGLLTIAIWSLIVNGLLIPMRTLTGYYIVNVHNGGENEIAYVSIFANIGLIIGSAFTSIKKNWKRPLKNLLISSFGIFLGVIIFTIAPFRMYWIIAIGQLILGINLSICIAMYYTYFQIIVPADNQGKAFAFDTFISLLISPVALFLGGILAELIDIQVMFYFIGIIGFLINIPIIKTGIHKFKIEERDVEIQKLG